MISIDEVPASLAWTTDRPWVVERYNGEEVKYD